MLLTARNIIRNIMFYSSYYHTVNSTHDIYDIILREKKHIYIKDS